MIQQNKKIQELYYNYKKRDDEFLLKKLEKIQIVKLMNKGVGTIQGYYPLTDDALDKLRLKLRKVSLIFDITETKDEPIPGLKVYKELIYLVKSSSRFFLKPDIGEIFDQISISDIHGSTLKAICFLPDAYESLEGTDGEHFIMKALLLTNE